MAIDIPEGYEALASVFADALSQAAGGKGAERHAYSSAEPFSSQLICEIPFRLGAGGECFCLGQAVKKIYESRRLPPERARAELLGALNYIAAAVLAMAPKSSGAVSAPEDADFSESRMRESIPGLVPEDADAPRFQKGELVEYRSPDGKWKPASFMHMDGGYAVLASGGERFEILASGVRPAEKA